jgi:hypothetical protein
MPVDNSSKVDKTIVNQGASASSLTNNQMQLAKQYAEDKKKNTISSKHARVTSNQNKKVVELPQQDL